MKKKLLALAVIAALFFGWNQLRSTNVLETPTLTVNETLSEAYSEKKSDILVKGEGQVIKILADDNKGSRHQRFIIRLSSGQTLLVSHNIDLAPRISSLETGDKITFYGEYEWNPEGGVIHWTHNDPDGSHQDGWIKHDGKTYQ